MNGRRLYSEIGGVDEFYLQQAALYRAKRKKPVWRAVLIAAVLCLVASLVIGTLAMSLGIALIGWISGLAPDQPQHPDQPDQPEQLSELVQMEDSLLLKQTLMHAVDAEELDLFGGYCALIWREYGSDTYYTIALTEREMEQTLYLMQKERTEFSADSEQPRVQIWLCMGDGLVLSPYLKNTAGNTGHGEVFDYDPELELSDELAEWIARCVAS